MRESDGWRDGERKRKKEGGDGESVNERKREREIEQWTDGKG